MIYSWTDAIVTIILLQFIDAEMLQLAQSCDAHTAVGLARCPNSSRGFFLPPPSLYKVRDETVRFYSFSRKISFKMQ